MDELPSRHCASDPQLTKHGEGGLMVSSGCNAHRLARTYFMTSSETGKVVADLSRNDGPLGCARQSAGPAVITRH